ncbi:hypothetical protein MNBD_ACTINO02-1259 [hydrothermal vent metagenome]|uniref:Uncharacterized protein n=1 Tax=hydrothermal vent metagenome TaxID=652676 RepID=A0A3B0RUB2_9ZZZZ
MLPRPVSLDVVGSALRVVGYVVAGAGLLLAGWVLLTGYEYDPNLRAGVLALPVVGLLLVAVGQKVGDYTPRFPLSGIQRGVVAIGTFFFVVGLVTVGRGGEDRNSEFTGSGVPWLVVGAGLFVGLAAYIWWSRRKTKL